MFAIRTKEVIGTYLYFISMYVFISTYPLTNPNITWKLLFQFYYLSFVEGNRFDTVKINVFVCLLRYT